MPRNHRALNYTIIRVVRMNEWRVCDPAILDSFRTLERAEEVKGIYEQQMKENGLEGQFEFHIQTHTWYDE